MQEGRVAEVDAVEVLWREDEVSNSLADSLLSDGSKESEDKLYEELGERDPDRWDAYRDAHWHFVGCYARATLSVCGTIQTVRSPGLWGIESDSSAEYKAEVQREELAELRDILIALGLDVSRLDLPQL